MSAERLESVYRTTNATQHRKDKHFFRNTLIFGWFFKFSLDPKNQNYS